MVAMRTAAHPASQSGGATAGDVPKGFPLLEREGVVPQEIGFTTAEDIGRFQPMPH